MHDKLRRTDLNLLLIFDALFRHKSVVGAASELAMSPSAVSHAIARLRDALSDELFVRYGSAMQPTAHAEQMAEVIAQSLTALNGCLESARSFNPAGSKQTFVFAATDFTAFAILPALISQLERVAPYLKIRVIYSTHSESLSELQAGRIHFALGLRNGSAKQHDGIGVISCYEDEYVVAAKKNHPWISGTLSLEEYLQARHVVVIPWADEGSIVNTALERLGLTRDVAVQLPSLLAAPFIVAKSSYLITLPSRLATEFSSTAPLAVYPAPFAIPPYTLEIYYHHRHAGVPGHEWLRSQIRLALLN